MAIRKINIIIILISFTSILGYSQEVFEVNHQYQSDISVMIVDAPYKADLLVYKANSTNQIENDGTIWHFVDAAYKANKKVYFVENEYQADIKVYFVEAKHQAKWINNEKRYLLQIE